MGNGDFFPQSHFRCYVFFGESQFVARVPCQVLIVSSVVPQVASKHRAGFSIVRLAAERETSVVVVDVAIATGTINVVQFRFRLVVRLSNWALTDFRQK